VKGDRRLLGPQTLVLQRLIAPLRRPGPFVVLRCGSLWGLSQFQLRFLSKLPMYKLISSKKGGLLYIPKFYNKEQSDYYLDYIRIFQNPNKIEQKIKGRLFPLHRKILYYGEKDYSYSGLTHKATGKIPKEFMRVLADIKHNNNITKLIKTKNIDFLNTVLINYYENENNSLAWHSDDEPELGPDNEKNILVVSLSLGDSREFAIRSKDNKISSKVLLENGDLVIMYGNFQKEFEHSIPKAKNKKKLRVNLTYRNILK